MLPQAKKKRLWTHSSRNSDRPPPKVALNPEVTDAQQSWEMIGVAPPKRFQNEE